MDAIDRIVYINLDARPDRRAEIEAELLRLGLQDRAQRFAAVPHEVGAYGCACSHLAVLRAARDDPSVQQLLVLEDDFQLVVEPEVLDRRVRAFMDAHGNDFDTLLLAVNLLESEDVGGTDGDGTQADAGGKVLRVRHGQTTGGYIASRRVFDSLIGLWERHLACLLDTRGDVADHCIDIAWLSLQSTGRWFTFSQRPAMQRPSYSDILRRRVAYGC
jgi:glycosyl transferase family 25